MMNQRVQSVLEERRKKALEEADKRIEIIRNKLPKYKIIERKLVEKGIQLARLKLEGKDEKKVLLELKEIEKEKINALRTLGYELEYIEPKFTCSICEDIGRTGDGDCQCKKKIQANFIFKDNPFATKIKEETFENFDINIFRDETRGEENESPRANMIYIKKEIKDFVENFDNYRDRNILLYGPVGTGKSYLSHSMAAALTKKDIAVISHTAYGIFELFQKARFSNFDERNDREEALNKLMDVDVLFLDDWGTEPSYVQAIGYSFELINERILKGKSTIISTNLEPRQIEERYSKRIFSRLFAHYDLYRIFGDDLRMRV